MGDARTVVDSMAISEARPRPEEGFVVSSRLLNLGEGGQGIHLGAKMATIGRFLMLLMLDAGGLFFGGVDMFGLRFLIAAVTARFSQAWRDAGAR